MPRASKTSNADLALMHHALKDVVDRKLCPRSVGLTWFKPFMADHDEPAPGMCCQRRRPLLAAPLPAAIGIGLEPGGELVLVRIQDAGQARTLGVTRLDHLLIGQPLGGRVAGNAQAAGRLT